MPLSHPDDKTTTMVAEASTPLHSCTSSTFSDDSFDGSPQRHTAKPANPATAAAMQRQTMHHVLCQLGGCTHAPPAVQPRHSSRHASTSDEDDGRCSSSAGEPSPPPSDAHGVRPLARAVSMPSSAATSKSGPAWLHGNALSSKAMHAVLQQAMVLSSCQHTGSVPIPRDALCHPANPPTPVGWLDDAVRVQPPPRCDLHRMALCITPLLRGDVPPSHVTIRDLLRVLEPPSLHGMPVPTHHSSRGPSMAYYAPSLSAMRLFVASPTDPGAGDQDGPRWRLPSGDVVRVAVEAFEADAPFARGALEERVRACLAGSGLEVDTPLSQLHPQSWLAVAWYPVYRIPDAPLAARFLALYALAPQRAGPHHIMLPLAGLWWHNVVAGTPPGVAREQWMATDPSHVNALHDNDTAANNQQGDVPDETDVSKASSVQALSNMLQDATLAHPVTVLVNPYGGHDDWPAAVKRLQEAVPAMARGVGVVGADDDAPLPAPFFADYDFFASRRDLNAL